MEGQQPLDMRGMFVEALRAVEPEPVLQQAEALPDPVADTPPPAEVIEGVEPTAPNGVVDDFILDLNEDPLSGNAPAPAAEPAAATPPEEETDIEALKQWALENGTTPARWNNIYRGHQTLQALAKSPEEGGIGFRPSVDQLHTAWKSHEVFDLMKTEFETGVKDAATPFADYWFGLDQDGKPFPGSLGIAQNLPEALARANPQAYQALSAPIISGFQAKLEEMAKSEGYTQADRDRLADAAALISHFTNSPVQPNAPRTAAKPQNDPSDEVARLREENRLLRGGEQQRAVAAISTTIDSHINKVIDADVERALSPLEEHYKSNPKTFQALKGQFRAEIQREVQSNPSIMRMVNTARTRMIQRGSTQELPDVTRMVRQAYESSLRSHRTDYLKEAGLSVVAKNNQARSTLQQAAQKTAPATNGAAPSEASGALRARNPNETPQEYQRYVFRAALSGGR